MRMRRWFGLIPVLLLAGACTKPQGMPTPSTDPNAVEVLITATPVMTEAGIELCPVGMNGKCPGIILEGDLAPEFFQPVAQHPPVIRIQGSYDGARLIPTTPAVRISPHPPFGLGSFASLCPGMTGTGGPNPYVENLTSYTQSVPDTFAAMWWDQNTSVMTVWFVGDDVEGHRSAIEAALGPTDGVCVAGGARFSEADLLEAMDLLAAITDRRGDLATGGYGIYPLANRIAFNIQEIDAALRQVIANTVGERVVSSPYLEVINDTLADLPAPVSAVPGNVDLLTNRLRYGGAMDAQDQFRVGYDSALNCIYFDGSEAGPQGRTVPVWPFGYSAINDPVEIYDYDGGLIATQGTVLELGGGFVDVGFVDGNTCGAVSAWIVSDCAENPACSLSLPHSLKGPDE